MALLDMQAMEPARDAREGMADRSTASLLSQQCKDSVVSAAIC